MRNMFCCKQSSVKVDNSLPYEYRLYLLRGISSFVEERRFSDAKKKLREVNDNYVEVPVTSGPVLIKLSATTFVNRYFVVK